MVNRGLVPVLSDAWWECVEHAVREAERLGIKVGMFNCPGWSQSGGPWVEPGQAMRYLVSTELRVSGPCKLRERLETPAEHFQQVAIKPSRSQSMIRTACASILRGYVVRNSLM